MVRNPKNQRSRASEKTIRSLELRAWVGIVQNREKRRKIRKEVMLKVLQQHLSVGVIFIYFVVT